MRIEGHYENFMSQPDVERYVDLYCSILENRSDELHEEYLRQNAYDDGEF